MLSREATIFGFQNFACGVKQTWSSVGVIYKSTKLLTDDYVLYENEDTVRPVCDKYHGNDVFVSEDKRLGNN